MSIIYQAHKKSGASNNTKMGLRSPRSFIWFDIGLWLLIAVLLMYTSIAYFPKVKKHLAKPVPHPAIILNLINEADYLNKHKLTGVFLSNQENVALINNHYYHLGDVIDGMKVAHIDLNNVTLTSDHQKFVLSQQTV